MPESEHVFCASAQSTPNKVVADAKLNYLRVMLLALLSELDSLGESLSTPAAAIDLKTEVTRFESELIRSALNTTKGQQRRAASLLSTNATTLNSKLKRLKIWSDVTSEGFASPQSKETSLDVDGRPLTFTEAVRRYEISLIRNALVHAGGNQSKAARLLGLPTTTFHSKIKKLKIHIASLASDSGDLAQSEYHSAPNLR